MNEYRPDSSMSERELLLEMREKLNDMDQRRRRFHTVVMSMLAVITAVVCIAALILVPKLTTAVEHYEQLVARLEPVLDQVGKLDFDKLGANFDAISGAAEEIGSLDLEALSKKIDAIDMGMLNEKLSKLDMDALNEAVTNLNTAIAPLMRLFG